MGVMSNFSNMPENWNDTTTAVFAEPLKPTTSASVSITSESLTDLIVAKVIAMLVLGFCSFGLGILPVKLASWLRWNKGTNGDNFIISLSLCFGGGVLLFTTFIHLQPEVREGMEHLQEHGEMPDFPHLAELIFCGGFFFVYLVEELVHAVLDRRSHEREDEAVLHRTMSLRRCSRHPHNHGESSCEGNAGKGTMIPRVSLGHSNSGATAPATVEGTAKKSTTGDSLADTNGSTGSSSMSASTQGLLSTIVVPDSKSSPLDAEAHMTGGPLGKRGNRYGHHHHHHHHHHNHHGHGHSHGHALPDVDGLSSASSSDKSAVVTKSFRGFLAVLALSFHAVFEGLAVGLESKVANVWYLFAAIATHKLVIAFCVGMELVGSRTRLVLVFVYLATFAAVTPLGIGVGIALSGGEAVEGTAVTVILQCMAAGTLLYVVFFEVLQREKVNTQAGIWQLAAIMAGFAVMFSLQLFTGHEHNHGHGHGHDHDHQEAFINLNLTDQHDHDHDHDHHHYHHHH